MKAKIYPAQPLLLRFAASTLLLALLLPALFAFPLTLLAAPTYTVTSGADSGAGSLREGMSTIDSGGTITIPASVSTISLDVALVVAKDMTITAAAGHTVTITVSGDFRHIMGYSAAVVNFTLQGITFQGLGGTASGGGVYLSGNGSVLTVQNCIFMDNRVDTTTFGAGIRLDGASSRLEVSGSTFQNNISLTTSGAGGAVYAPKAAATSFSDCTFTANATPGTDGRGGALFVSTATITDCTFTGNTAGRQAGAVDLDAGTCTLTGCTFINNSALQHAGALHITGNAAATLTDCIFNGNSTTDNSVEARGGAIWSNGALTIAGGEFVSNSSYMDGGAIFTSDTNALPFAATGTLFEDNTAQYGGALYSTYAAVLTNCTLAGNSATVSGGAVYSGGNTSLATCTLHGNEAPSGGAVYAGAITSLTASTLYNNRAQNGGAVYSAHAATLINCTLSGNAATQSGGGVYGSADATAQPVLIKCTLSGNTAAAGGGGAYAAGPLTLNGSIVSGNYTATGAADELFAAGANQPYIPFGAAATNGSLVTENTLVGLPPGLDLSQILTTTTVSIGGTSVPVGLLANNTGPVLTIMPYLERINPALVAVPLAASWIPATDARGVPKDSGQLFCAGAVWPTRVSSISLPGTVYLEVGETFPLILITNPSVASVEYFAGDYASSTSGTVSVDQNGEVTAHAPGTVTITFTTVDGTVLTATCQIIVLSGGGGGSSGDSTPPPSPGPGEGNVPQTDDSSLAPFWLGILLFSTFGLVFLAFLAKRQNHSS